MRRCNLGLFLPKAAVTAVSRQPSYRRRVSDEHLYTPSARTAGNVLTRGPRRARHLQKTALRSRDAGADGQRRRRLVDDYYSDRLLYGRRAVTANVPDP